MIEVSERAREVYDQLSPTQRALFPHMDKPVEDQMRVLGVGRSQAYAAASKLRSILAELVPNDGLRTEVGLEVYRLCVVNP